MEKIVNLLFGYWYRAPLLFSTFDWAMCVGQLALLKWCIDNLRSKKNLTKKYKRKG